MLLQFLIFFFKLKTDSSFSLPIKTEKVICQSEEHIGAEAAPGAEAGAIAGKALNKNGNLTLLSIRDSAKRRILV